MNHLIISCTGNKLDEASRAINLYQARQFKIAKELLSRGWLVTILSAKYGFLADNEIVDPYDLKMDRLLSDSFIRRYKYHETTPYPFSAAIKLRSTKVGAHWEGGDLEAARRLDGNTNYVYGGENYRRIVRALDRNVTELVGKNRGNGDHYSALKALLLNSSNGGN